MGYLCNGESAIAACDPHILQYKNYHHRHHNNPIQLRHFTFSDLESATNAFSPSNLLGKGSHGSVYKAVLDGGKLIAAVKKTTVSGVGGNRNGNFNSSITNNNNNSAAENEIEILSKIRSSRIVNLIGYGVDSRQRKLLLVVELMSNGSLYDLIHKSHKPPGWSTRIRFALQVAKAVQMLHGSNPPVIHRDIKSSNILIDEKGNAKLSDFGLALRGHVEDVRVMSTPPAGTLGYLDPCYLAPGDLSAKNDVFSFGILLLEIISGRRAIDVNYSPPSVVDWALPLIKAGAHAEICDRRIGCPADPTLSVQLGVLAARCVRSTAETRPTMAEVVDLLRIIYKRFQSPVWNNLRRRVRRVEEPRRLIRVDSFEGGEAVKEEDKVRNSRHGSRRSLCRNRRVSSVPTTVDETKGRGMEKGTGGGERVARSKSVGSFSEIRVGPEVVKGRAQVAVRLSRVRLSKSRSMGVLQSKGNSEESNGGGGHVKVEQVKNPQLKEQDVCPLLVNANKNKSALHYAR